ncbi:MAG: GntR family transcriptional regulator [Dethiobacteria bacterium]|jgi:DNA-binding GntR family transcriptional regulator|nr:GntR family transcriptional regulator [Bacillota bacterium]
MQDNNNIYNEIKRRIIELEYQPGQLLNEKKLTEEFKVSRTPIREALLKLSQKKLVEIVPRVGTIVAQVDIKQIKYIYEVKKNLEALAAELAAQRATEEEIAELLEIAGKMESCDAVAHYREYIHYDQLFHKVTREASNNPVVIEYLEDLNAQTARFLRYVQFVVDDPERHNQSIKAIAEAIKNRYSLTASEEAEKHSIVTLERLSKMVFQ